MHCIVPFAAPASEAGRAALNAMRWPVLAALLWRMTLVARDEAEATTFSAPHERALARALGWEGPEAGAGRGAAGAADASDAVDAADGRRPLAALSAQADGLDVGDAAWGLLSPVHWHVGTDQVSLADPQALQLDEPTSRALFEAVRPLFEDDAAAGETEAGRPRLVFGHATRWYVAHASLAGLRTASLDRVAGRNVDPWLVHEGATPAETAALRRWRRLQAEVQMLLHAHPVNAEREGRGLPAVNSFWLSGCGALPRTTGTRAPAAVPQVDLTLRAAALSEDWAAWAAAWGRVEAGALAALGQALECGEDARLTLAGERAAVTFAPARRGVVTRLKGWFARPSVSDLLASL